jgi:hypothetical protein
MDRKFILKRVVWARPNQVIGLEQIIADFGTGRKTTSPFSGRLHI